MCVNLGNVVAVGLTAHEHEANGEDLFGLGVRGDVPEPHGGQPGHREVDRGDVARLQAVLLGYDWAPISVR